MFENPGRGRQARNFITNVPKILDLKSSSEQIFRKLSLGVPVNFASSLPTQENMKKGIKFSLNLRIQKSVRISMKAS